MERRDREKPHVTILPDPFLWKSMWRMGEGSQPYRNSFSWFALETAPAQHLLELHALHRAQADTWARGFLSKKSAGKQGFPSSPTLHLAAFPHSCGKDEENPPPVQNRLLGRTQLLMAFQAQLAVLRAGFNFTTNPPVSGVNPTARQERRVESQQQGCLHKLFYLQTWKLIPGDTGCFSALDLFPGLAR